MSRPVARTGDLVFTGHLCSIIAPIGPSVTTVFTAGLPTSVAGTLTVIHTIKIGSKCKPHVLPTYASGATVFATGRPVNKIGDPADLGVIITGAPTVFCI